MFHPVDDTSMLVSRSIRLALLILLTGTESGSAADWPCWRGLHHNGISQEVDWVSAWPDASPPVLWQASLATGFSSLAIADGRLLTMGNENDADFVYCLDANSGLELWRHTYPSPLDPNLFEGGPTSTPAIDGQSVYTLSRRGDLFCLDLSTGDVRWSVNLHEDAEAPIPGWGFASSPLVHGSLVLVNVGEAGAALDGTTGELVWKSNAEEAGYTSPVPMEQRGKECVLMTSGTQLSCLDVQSGTPLWHYRWITRYGVTAADPMPTDGYVFVTSGYGKGAALLKLTDTDPKEVWRARTLRNQLSPGVLLDGAVYAFDGDAGQETSLRCIEVATGEQLWSEPDIEAGALIAANGQLIIATLQGELVIGPASKVHLEPTCRAQVITGKCWTPPALAHGLLYLRNAVGDVVCVDLRRHSVSQ